MLEMPTIDRTDEWEENLDQEAGDLKFPVTLFDSIDLGEFSIPEVKVESPRLKKTSIKEIKLGKKPKNKRNELF